MDAGRSAQGAACRLCPAAARRHLQARQRRSRRRRGGEPDAVSRPGAVDTDGHVYFEAASDGRLDLSRIGRLSKIVDQQGAGAKTLPPDAGIAPNHIRVVVERYVVTPPPCPNWTSPPTGDHGNQPGSNFGCADATNLSLMVADPRDLVIGRPLGPAQGDPAFAAALRYRQGKVKDPSGQSAGSAYAAPQSSGGGSAAAGAGAGDSGQ